MAVVVDSESLAFVTEKFVGVDLFARIQRGADARGCRGVFGVVTMKISMLGVSGRSSDAAAFVAVVESVSILSSCFSE